MTTPDPEHDRALPSDSPVVIPQLLYTPKQAAAALAIGHSKLYELLAEGELEAIHIGSCRRIPAQALDEFIEQRRAEARALGRLA